MHNSKYFHCKIFFYNACVCTEAACAFSSVLKINREYYKDSGITVIIAVYRSCGCDDSHCIEIS